MSRQLSDTTQPDVLFVITDQQRFDTIHALGNTQIRTPNLDRLVRRGVAFTNAYSTCPVCIPARYTLHSGSDSTRTGIYDNFVAPGQHQRIAEYCGPYLPEAMSQRGYRTFGVGKFHTIPWNAPLGYETILYSEEFYSSEEQRSQDDYAAWIAREHPAHDWIEALMGERTEMYYMPQMSPLPAQLCAEAWATDRALELIIDEDPRPWFGVVSFIGPHPPFAPPLPYNRMYDPDEMSAPVTGDIEVDHLDRQIPWMNHAVFADHVDADRARVLKARYYGEITYIDSCVGRLLDTIDARPGGANTLICFIADHGDLLGDHGGWQKECYFEAATRIPFIMSWPARLPPGRNDALVSLVDLFGIATTAAGDPDLRQGVDVLGHLTGSAAPRTTLHGAYGSPGTERFKIMAREGRYKLIWLANGGQALLFDLENDPGELHPIQDQLPHVVNGLLRRTADQLHKADVSLAFCDGALRQTPYRCWDEPQRIYQFDASRGVTGYQSAESS